MADANFPSADTGSDSGTDLSNISANTIPVKDATGDNFSDSGITVDASTGVITYATDNVFLNAGANKVSRNPVTVIEVHTASDIEDLATGGVVTLSVNTTLDIKNAVSINVVFVLTNNIIFLITGNTGAGANIVYTGTGTFISGSGAFRMSFSALISTSGSATLFDISDGSNVATQNAALIGWDNLGTATNIGSFATRFAAIVNCTTGFSLINTGLDVLDSNYDDVMVGPVYTLLGQECFTHNVKGAKGTMDVSSSFIRVDPGINNDTSVNIVQSNIRTGQIFDTTGGATGVFTSVTNSSTVAEPIIDVITSPTTSGRARFVFSGGPPNIDIGEIATLSTFAVETTYNVTGTVVVTDLNSFFELDGVDFEGPDIGQFDTSAVRFVEASTTIVVGDTLVIDTTDATTYDGGFIVFSAGAGSFTCNGNFDGAAEGTWDTSGVDQSDLRVVALDNPGFASSSIMGSLFVNNNVTATTGIVNNTFQDIVFGTAGSAMIPTSGIERFKLIDELNGTLEYLAGAPLEAQIGYNFSVDSSGGSVEFRFKFVVDRGAGFIDLDDNVEALAEVGATASSITKSQPVTLFKGDQIKPQLTRNTGASDITMRYASINITR